MATAAARIRPAPGELPAEGRGSDVARIPAPARAAAGLCRLAYPAHAKGADADERSAAPCRVRHHGHDRDAYRSRHYGGRAGPSCAGTIRNSVRDWAVEPIRPWLR